MMRITFLGTVAARPTPNRNVSSVVIQREGELMMFDCGEGTQRQMMRYGTGFDVRDIFFTHLHADHFLGVIGLLRTMGLQERAEPIHLWAPGGAERLLHDALALCGGLPFEVVIGGLAPGDVLMRHGYDILCFRTQHKGRSLGYALLEHPCPGRLSPPRPARKVVYTGDTRPCAAVQGAAEDADVLIHEATFGHDEADRARATGHSTAEEAAQIARGASVRSLILTHLSARYTDDARVLEAEARRIFPEARVAHDGLSIDFSREADVEGYGGSTELQ